MKNTIMILAAMVVFAACGSPKQVEEVEQFEEIYIEVETDLEESSDEDIDSERPAPIE
jgi:PBP1b-binding outer membrane lipoprotein LpoB